jgi:hypothetical protein
MRAEVTESLLTDYPDREGLIVELWAGANLFMTVSEDPELAVEIWPTLDGTPWELTPGALLSALRAAESRLRRE